MTPSSRHTVPARHLVQLRATTRSSTSSRRGWSTRAGRKWRWWSMNRSKLGARARRSHRGLWRRSQRWGDVCSTPGRWRGHLTGAMVGRNDPRRVGTIRAPRGLDRGEAKRVRITDLPITALIVL